MTTRNSISKMLLLVRVKYYSSDTQLGNSASGGLGCFRQIFHDLGNHPLDFLLFTANQLDGFLR